MIPPTLYWESNVLWILDQRKLPLNTEYIECRHYEDVAQAIETLSVRGAPAIGIAAAYGAALGALSGKGALEDALERLKRTRPTAVNLFWSIERIKSLVERKEENDLFSIILEEAEKMLKEDISINRSIGLNGQSLFSHDPVIITHCNAGALATGGYGTALGVIRALRDNGKEPEVYACETRPLLQGARLTAWELKEDDINVTLITDSMAGALMSKKRIHAVITGADRITSKGDTANKIGTYSLAVLARVHKVPFYVASPLSTFDFNLTDGSCIEIEERDPEEVRRFRTEQIARQDIKVWNPAFDVTPSSFIDCIITEKGLIYPPYEKNIAKIKSQKGDLYDERT